MPLTKRQLEGLPKPTTWVVFECGHRLSGLPAVIPESWREHDTDYCSTCRKWRQVTSWGTEEEVAPRD